jgi:hypothetical protein
MSVAIFGFLGTDKVSNYPLLVPNVKVHIGTNLKEPSIYNKEFENKNTHQNDPRYGFDYVVG